jgi:hypothetical protein
MQDMLREGLPAALEHAVRISDRQAERLPQPRRIEGRIGGLPGYSLLCRLSNTAASPTARSKRCADCATRKQPLRFTTMWRASLRSVGRRMNVEGVPLAVPACPYGAADVKLPRVRCRRRPEGLAGRWAAASRPCRGRTGRRAAYRYADFDVIHYTGVRPDPAFRSSFPTICPCAPGRPASGSPASAMAGDRRSRSTEAR